MPRDLFGSVTNPPARIGSGSRVTVPLSLGTHALALVAIVVAPLVATDVLPAPRQVMTVILGTPALPPDPPPPAPARTPPPVEAAMAHSVPIAEPQGIVPEALAPPAPDLTFAGSAGLVGGPATVLGEPLAAPEPSPPPRARHPPVRVGGAIQPPTKIVHVAPVYPPIALAAQISGVVIIQATIGVDGRVVDASILRSAPLLDQAALDAVRQWRFTPTSLNGEPVPVVMTVSVLFHLR